MVEFLRRLGTRATTEQIFARAGIQPRRVAETATNMAALELVREGLGVAIVNPFPLLVSGMEGIEVRPFDAPISYNTSFVLPSGVPPSQLARQFMRERFMMANILTAIILVFIVMATVVHGALVANAIVHDRQK